MFNENKNSIRKDIGWMYVIYISNFIFPILLIPYLTRVLGASGWGYLAFWLSVNIAITMIVEYGFNISGQRAAAKLCNNKEELSVLFSQVISAKILLAIIICIIFLFFIFTSPYIADEWQKLVGVLYCGIIQGLNVSWFFRGINQIKLATAIEVAAKLISISIVLLSVSDIDHAWRYFYAFGVGHMVILIIAIWKISLNINFNSLSISSALIGLKDGANIFILHATGTIFTISSIFFLGFQVSTKEIGYFSGADKIIRFISNIIEPIRHALFPKINQEIYLENGQINNFILRLCILFSLVSLLLGGIVYFMATNLVILILGVDFLPSVPYLRIMSILLPILVINATLGYLWMIPNGLERVCVMTVAIALLINIILGSVLVPIFGVLGMVIALIISEFFIISIFIYYFNKGIKWKIN